MGRTNAGWTAVMGGCRGLTTLFRRFLSGLPGSASSSSVAGTFRWLDLAAAARVLNTRPKPHPGSPRSRASKVAICAIKSRTNPARHQHQQARYQSPPMCDCGVLEPWNWRARLEVPPAHLGSATLSESDWSWAPGWIISDLITDSGGLGPAGDSRVRDQKEVWYGARSASRVLPRSGTRGKKICHGIGGKGCCEVLM